MSHGTYIMKDVEAHTLTIDWPINTYIYIYIYNGLVDFASLFNGILIFVGY